MNDNSNVLTSILSGAAETRQLEFKEGFNWEAQGSSKLREELIKAILAMSNTPGGGLVIIGVRTDTRTKAVFLEGLSDNDAESFGKNQEQIKTIVHNYCQRPIDFEIKSERYPEDGAKWFIVFQVSEFSRWPTVTAKSGKVMEDNGKSKVIEYHAVYTRSKLAQWSSVKAGPREIEDIVETAVKKYDTHVRSLGYTRVTPRDQGIKIWFLDHQGGAHARLKGLGIQAHMEVKAKFVDPNGDFDKIKLRDAARESTVPTFGWPIAAFLDSRDEYRPVADTNGVKAEMAIERHDLGVGGRKTYDYWALHTSGAFYLLKSIFEDLRNPEIISFNTRIVRITEVFMYLRNLYSSLGIEADKEFEIIIRHGGIRGRRLDTLSSNRLMFEGHTAGVEEVTTPLTTSISQFSKDPSGVVEKFTQPLFECFDFFQLEQRVLDEVVQSYLVGRVT